MSKTNFSLLEHLAIAFFNPVDTFYHSSGLKRALGFKSMHDYALRKSGANSYDSIKKVILDKKYEKVHHLRALKLECGGDIPRRYKLVCYKSPCGRLRLRVANNK